LDKNPAMPLPHLRLLLASAIALTAAPARAADTRAAFTEEATCPALSAGTDATLRLVSGATDRRTCAVECSLWPACVVAYHSPAAATCQLGTLAAWLQFWQAGSCRSLVRPPPIPDNVAPKLLAFYNFRFSLSNQLNASAFGLTANNAARNRLGVELLGSFDSNLEVDLMGGALGHYLPHNQLSFFIKVTATYDFEGRCFHWVFNRSVGAPDGGTGRWCRGVGGRAVFLERDLTRREFTSGSEFLPQDFSNPATYSTAVAIDLAETNMATFFYNGTRDSSAATYTTDPDTLFGDGGLKIGYSSFSPFKGTLHCYGIAAAALNLTEVQQLETLC
uniref:Lectin_legB domain-containing protein n=1 Tax=Macrostomum lignano TaxID=282301 RepID=A0A1I8H603_9PLAT